MGCFSEKNLIELQIGIYYKSKDFSKKPRRSLFFRPFFASFVLNYFKKD